MNHDMDELDQAAHELFAPEVSDEALEQIATVADAAYTLGACTGLSVCPA